MSAHRGTEPEPLPSRHRGVPSPPAAEVASGEGPPAEAPAGGPGERPVRIVYMENPERYRPGDEVTLQGIAAAWNYTYGPIYLYEGPRSIDEIYRLGEPVVVFAETIPMEELRKIELTRVRGFVFEGGSAADDELYNFLFTENRAAVIGCTGALFFAEQNPGAWVIVDGVLGLVCFNPSAETLERFQRVRAQGPPERDRTTAIAQHFNTILEGKLEEKRRREAAGEPVGHPTFTPQQAQQAQAAAPGLVLSLLSGLPLPGLVGGEDGGGATGGASQR
ncbi:MAG: hypothetical protein KatS3mg102_0461 [Planctomycetota bacterium]|nr:MAG: hypothetical protein KatS3mg102_0461 [Planctomycetota bacterium]